MEDNRGETGRFTPEHTDADILAAVRAHEPAATSEVAGEVGMTRQGADRRLRQLRDEGRVNSKKIAASLVWFAPRESAESGREQGATGAEETPDRSPTPAAPADDAPEESAHADDLAAVVDAVAADVLPGSGAKLEERREALLAAVEYLREHGTATPQEFQTDVYPDHQGRYTEGADPARSWWKNCIYKGLRALADRTDAVEKADETGEWSYHGDDLDARGDT